MSKGKRLTSTVTSDSTVHLRIEEFEVPTPGPDEVLIAVEASPINPSDLGLLLAGAHPSTASKSENGLTLSLPDGAIDALTARIDQAMPVGNEGAGTVIDTGDEEQARALQGQTVAVLAGGMYATHRIAKARDCLVLQEGTEAIDAASCFVNPLTALGMTETMRLEGHTALIHTAAASNLGQMLQKICIADDIDLVNIVRREEQAELLRGIGAKYVCNSSADSFRQDLTQAIAETGAYVAFDATGGGVLADQILASMETAAQQTATEYSRYGSTQHKQVYIYGGLDRSQTTLNRSYGMMWGLGGWLLTPFLQKIGPVAAEELRQRVAREIKTTFASHYTKEVSLAEALTLDAIKDYGQMATGEKYLINPSK